ncbi:unnamed protein product, partial [Mesorhabditis belari]|uniref:Methanethiol oxidase n=1 Tax=Mesorhabditis belari TaxID=2138241 RepID=A0AAF3FSJ6_9BILA
MSCCKNGPGYATPKDAIKGPREKVIFVTTPNVDLNGFDAVCTVDVDPESPTYCQVISKVDLSNRGDEVHHTGWNACSSCHGDPSAQRSHLIAPCLNSDRIYIINVKDPKNLRLEKVIPSEKLKEHNVSFPHTSHCLADGSIMISTLGDENGNNKGNFLLLDGKTFEPKNHWNSNGNLQFNYDFWYQPRKNVMISTEWGVPNLIKNGFNPEHFQIGKYGHNVNVFDWKNKVKKQTIELPLPQGAIPLEIRFLHEPSSPDCFVGAALGSSIFHLHPSKEDPEKQYDISDPQKPKLTGQLWLGGSLHTDSRITVKTNDFKQPPPLIVNGKRIEGAPQMLQLSLDGKRLYVTTSLYRPWDAQFYPNLLKEGGVMLQIDINPDGGMTLNQDFLIDFGKIEGGPYVAHEMRYPGGDCTSDIWI